MRKLIITGSVPSKKNSRTNVAKGNRLMSFPNQTFVKWERNAIKELATQDTTPFTEYPITLRCVFHVKDRVHRDLDNMLASVLDVIKDVKKNKVVVAKGIIADDSWRYISPITLEIGSIDKLNPRVEIYLDETRSNTPSDEPEKRGRGTKVRGRQDQ